MNMENCRENIIIKFENSSLECDKEILIRNSDYFSAMFSGNFRESTEKIINIQGVDVEIFKLILKILADNNLYVVKDEELILFKVLELSCMLQFNKVKLICEERINEILNPSNCLKIWKTTEILQLKPLWIKAKFMALDNLLSTNFLDMNLEDLCSYLGDIYLNMNSSNNELIVFQCAMNWWSKNRIIYPSTSTDEKAKIILKLLNCINFNKITDSDINKEMLIHSEIKNNEEICSVLNCIKDLKINGTNNIVGKFSEETLKNSIHLCKSRDRRKFCIPSVIAPFIDQIKENNDEKNSKFIIATNRNDTNNSSKYLFNQYFTIDIDMVVNKLKNLAGFKIISYKQFILIFGGGSFQFGREDWNMKFWIFDTLKEKWENETTLPKCRRHFQSVVLKDNIYIIGGLGRFRVRQNDLFYYNFPSNSWSPHYLLPHVGHKIADDSFECCVFQERLLFVYLREKCAFFFDETCEKIEKITIKFEKEIEDKLLNYNVFSHNNYLYIKGNQYLIKMVLQDNNLIAINTKEIGSLENNEIGEILCNDQFYSLYSSDSPMNNNQQIKMYTLEILDLESEDVIIKYKSNNDLISNSKATDECGLHETSFPYYYPYIKLFSLNHYPLVESTITVNNFFL